jgi:hypothetical protein
LPPKAVEDLDHKDIQFFDMNSATKGYGGKMVDAVLKDLPKARNGVVVMDWSDGLWDKMKSKEPDNKSLKLLHSRGVVMGSLVFC